MDTQKMDEQIQRLNDNKQAWVDLPLAEKIAMGRRLMTYTRDVAPRQVQAAIEAKSIPANSPLVGEEWLGGPLITIRTLRGTLNSLEDINKGLSPQLKAGSVRARKNGKIAVQVFPYDKWDPLLFKDFTAEVWMQEDVTRTNLADTMGVFYKEDNPEGKVALVLGAGNVASIGPLDVVYKLYAEGQVCLLKMNPVNEYLGEFIAEAFREFIDLGFLEIVYGGADVGAYLCSHDGIDEIHITGSDKTHDAIVYGVGEDGETRKAKDDRLNKKRITSELGNVSPIIIVPGKWSESDLKFHAENLATQLANNGGFNCNAGRVIITDDSWPQRQAFLDALREAYQRIPQRVPYYPGARDRFATWIDANKDKAELYGKANETYLPWAFVPNVDSEDHENLLLSQESFCGIQAETSLKADGISDFLAKAVDYCNNHVWGTLNACVIIDPQTEKRYADSLDKALEDLKYGSVVVNHWPALSYGFGQTTWGAYPGHTFDDIQSGIGVVHNSYLFDKPEKSVIRGPFRIFPKPPWFVTNKQTHNIAPALVEFELNPNIKNVSKILWFAVRG